MRVRYIVLLTLIRVILLAMKSTLDACLLYMRRLSRRRQLGFNDNCVLPRRSQPWLLLHHRCRMKHQARRNWFILAGIQVPRCYWVYPRSVHWWDHFVMNFWNDEHWLSNFRMTRGTFMDIVSVLRGHLTRKTTVMREPVSVEQRVAATIWYLANSNTYRQVTEQFGLGISTVGEIVLEVCFAMEKELLRKTICLGSEVGLIMDGFLRLGFPHRVGVVDRTHIPIRPLHGRAEEYRNRKKFCSMLLQGTVDHSGRFIDVEVGWSGRNHDAFVFVNSGLCLAMDVGVLIPGNPTITLNGVSVPPLVISDAAYPLRKWLMKPYGKTANSAERLFDRNLCRSRIVVEQCFG